MQAHALPPSTQPHPESTVPTRGTFTRCFADTRQMRRTAIIPSNDYLEAAGQCAATDFVFVAILKDSCIVKPNVNTIHLAPPPHSKPKLAPLLTGRPNKRTNIPSSTRTTPHRSAMTTAYSAAIPRLNVPPPLNTPNDSALPLAVGSPYSLTPTATLTRCPSSLLGSNEPTPLAYHKMSQRSDASSTLTPGKHVAYERKEFCDTDKKVSG
jgi:hypothetical protein